MRVRKRNVVFTLVTILLVGAVCIAFKALFLAPSFFSVEQRFKDNYNEIQLVVDFLVDSEHQVVYIFDADGTMQINFEDVIISDENVQNAVNTLIKGHKYRSIIKYGNTIILHQWSRSLNYGGGIAYSIDCSGELAIEDLTKVIPLSIDNWYYYESKFIE